MKMLKKTVVAIFLFSFCTAAGAAATANKELSGGWRLANESSPYLQMHADNPVQWYPWGKAAFDAARKENKLLFISVGYFTCHWCHVMERESFRDKEIAGLLNAGFIAIKVDREQRPDIDAFYMDFVRATRGRGGWPMSVWATPDGKPFVGGTYYPPDGTADAPGMKQLLPRLAALWKNDPEQVRQAGKSAMALLNRLNRPVKPLESLPQDLPVTARDQYARRFDEFYGGFGRAPKFPQPGRLLFLLQDDNEASHEMALLTLDKMAAGGIKDHLDGGFHRYSVDFEWRVPHFEKMLYDQALLARAYLHAYRVTGKKSYADEVRSILDFVIRDMRHAQGGFYSALSADSKVRGNDEHAEEGAYYTWTWTQLEAALPDKELRSWAVMRYGLAEEGNAVSDPRGEMSGRNVLYQADGIDSLAAHFKTDLLTARRRNAVVDRLLVKARRQRPPVPVDDKVIVVWNGYLVTALANAGELLDAREYTQAAQQAADFIDKQLYDPESGVLYRDWRDGNKGVPAYSEDYAAMAEGLLALHRASGKQRWLTRARQLVDHQIQAFYDWDAGGFFNTVADTDLPIRGKEAQDGATLSVNGVSVHVLLDLAKLTGDERYRDLAWQTAAWAGARLSDVPAAMPNMLIRWPELVLVKDGDSD